MEKILFVCTGNTCRSPMAEAIFNKYILEYGKSNLFKAFSAGIFASSGEKASENAICILKENWNIDLETHISKQLSETDILQAKLILTMESRHKEILISNISHLKDKIFIFKEFVIDEKINGYEHDINEQNLNISDPFGGTIPIYKECAKEIEKNIKKLISKLLQER